MKQSWQPLCHKEAVITRNNLYRIIRDFFYKQDVLEVETPLLSDSTVTDPFINSFEVFSCHDKSSKYYLQTSPEFAMKKMLCSGMGSIYQICKAFRSEENGKNHNKEFTMLEWYRVGFKLDELMQDMENLLLTIFNNKAICQSYPSTTIETRKISYTNLFKQYLNFDHNQVDSKFLINKINELFPKQFDNIINQKDFDKFYNKDDLLMILISDYIEPRLDKNSIYFIYDYPPTQAALAKTDSSGEYPVAKRFEVYYKGFELANGYYELADAKEQGNRFENDLKRRQQLGACSVNLDQQLIKALESGLPDCSGVAMGLDRILMILLGTQSIEDVIIFR